MLFAMVLLFSFCKGIIRVRILQKVYTVEFIQSSMLIIDPLRRQMHILCIYLSQYYFMAMCFYKMNKTHRCEVSLLLQCLIVWKKIEPKGVPFFSFIAANFLLITCSKFDNSILHVLIIYYYNTFIFIFPWRNGFMWFAQVNMNLEVMTINSMLL